MNQLEPKGAEPSKLSTHAERRKVGQAHCVADIGTVAVSENRNKPSSRLLSLPVIRIRSRNPAPGDAIFWLEGGPGMSNLKFAVPEWLLADHDIVMIGYRGVDGSASLDCPEVSLAFKGKGGDLLGPESLENVSRAMAQAARRLQAEGIALDGYNIGEVAHDMEAARVAFGYERISLLSVSYGTRVAQVFAYLYPGSRHRSAMIGVNPPGHFVWESKTIDKQLRYYSELWAKDPAQAALTPDLAETMRRVVHHMPRRWLFFPIDRGRVRMMTFAMLFMRGTASLVFDTYVAASRGDRSGLWLMSLVANFLFPKMLNWGDLLAKGGSADNDPTRDYVRELDPPDAILGSPIALGIWGRARNA